MALLAIKNFILLQGDCWGWSWLVAENQVCTRLGSLGMCCRATRLSYPDRWCVSTLGAAAAGSCLSVHSLHLTLALPTPPCHALVWTQFRQKLSQFLSWMMLLEALKFRGCHYSSCILIVCPEPVGLILPGIILWFPYSFMMCVLK